MPFKPRKCCGKKVILTPINIIKKCNFKRVLFIERPNIIGNQWDAPAKMAKTAPIDKT